MKVKSATDTYKLHNGVEIPSSVLAPGRFPMERAVSIFMPLRSVIVIDTAYVYGNEMLDCCKSEFPGRTFITSNLNNDHGMTRPWCL